MRPEADGEAISEARMSRQLAAPMLSAAAIAAARPRVAAAEPGRAKGKRMRTPAKATRAGKRA